jgi:hypothetical protein
MMRTLGRKERNFKFPSQLKQTRKVFYIAYISYIFSSLHFLHFSIWFSQVRNGEGGSAPARQVVVGTKFRIAGKIILRCGFACHSGERIFMKHF